MGLLTLVLLHEIAAFATALLSAKISISVVVTSLCVLFMTLGMVFALWLYTQVQELLILPHPSLIDTASALEDISSINSSGIECMEHGTDSKQPARTYHPLSRIDDSSVHAEVKYDSNEAIHWVADGWNSLITFFGDRLQRCPILPLPFSLLVLGAVGFLGTFCEASMVTWLVIYYDRVLCAPAPLRSAGFTCFMLASAAGRFSVDCLRERLDQRAVVLGAGLGAVAGLLLAFVSSFGTSGTGVMIASSAGFALTGFGVSMLAPIAFSGVGQLHPESSLSTRQQVLALSSVHSTELNALNAQGRAEDLGAVELTAPSSTLESFAAVEVPVHCAITVTTATERDDSNNRSVQVDTNGTGSGRGVSAVALLVYCGSTVGAPLVGMVADLTGSLRYGVLLVALVLILLVPLSGQLPSTRC